MKNIILFALLTLIILTLNGCTQNSAVCGDGVCSSEETDPNSNYFCTNDCGKEINTQAEKQNWAKKTYGCESNADCSSDEFCCGGKCHKKETGHNGQIVGGIDIFYPYQVIWACCDDKVIKKKQSWWRNNGQLSESIRYECCGGKEILVSTEISTTIDLEQCCDGKAIRKRARVGTTSWTNEYECCGGKEILTKEEQTGREWICCNGEAVLITDNPNLVCW